jgi:hypothetical protein
MPNHMCCTSWLYSANGREKIMYVWYWSEFETAILSICKTKMVKLQHVCHEETRGTLIYLMHRVDSTIQSLITVGGMQNNYWKRFKSKWNFSNRFLPQDNVTLEKLYTTNKFGLIIINRQFSNHNFNEIQPNCKKLQKISTVF